MALTSASNIYQAMEEEQEQAAQKARRDSDGGADISQEFWYLAGPMSNIPSFNFPRFKEVADELRSNGYNLVNPAELDHEIARVVQQEDAGSHKQLTERLKAEGIEAPSWAECLRRDIEYVAHPNCQGVLCLEGWQHSQGAQFETYVAYKLRKPIYAYHDAEEPTLVYIDRREELDAAGVVD